jgi:hypothetical protein
VPSQVRVLPCAYFPLWPPKSDIFIYSSQYYESPGDIMNTCQQGCEFYFCDGVVVNNTDDLAIHLKDLNNDQFLHHVNAEKNDFYNWVKDCIDPKLAKKIEGNVEQTKIVKTLSPRKKAKK